MFENLSKLLKIPETANPTLKKDAVAVLLKTSPETLAAFGQYNFTLGAARIITDRLPDERYRDCTDVREV